MYLDGFISASREKRVFVVQDVEVANPSSVAGKRLKPDLFQIET
jgi:hypothetical protein